MKKLAGIALLLAAALAAPMSAQAEFPDHVVTGIVPFDTGGGADIFARMLIPGLSKELGQNVIIENKPGAQGNLGISILSRAKPDGYTLLFNGAASVENPALFKNINYDPIKDIDSVADIAQSPYMVAINTDKIPAKTLSEFIDLIRKNPGKYNAGAGGIGSRLTVELFRQANDLKLEIITYTGTGTAVTAMLSGEVDFTIVAPGPLAAVKSSPKIRMLAITGDTRLPLYPDVPTTKEAGMPNYQVADYFTVYTRGGTPMDVRHKLNAALNNVMEQPEVADKFKGLGFTIVKRTAEQAQENYHHEVETWKDVVKKANIPPMD